ncbi:MAG: secondary thiamine-phosphate synthase enzyme YjbQ [Myxococcota bacterium]
MRIYQHELSIETKGRGLYDLGAEVAAIVKASAVSAGLCTIFVRHTSASLLIQENADPSVQRDLLAWLDDLAPESRAWEHDDEGKDDMPAHAKSAVTRTQESIPIADHRMVLGTWQTIYLVEHRTRPHQRKIFVHVSGWADPSVPL